MTRSSEDEWYSANRKGSNLLFVTNLRKDPFNKHMEALKEENPLFCNFEACIELHFILSKFACYLPRLFFSVSGFYARPNEQRME